MNDILTYMDAASTAVPKDKKARAVIKTVTEFSLTFCDDKDFIIRKVRGRSSKVYAFVPTQDSFTILDEKAGTIENMSRSQAIAILREFGACPENKEDFDALIKTVSWLSKDMWSSEDGEIGDHVYAMMELFHRYPVCMKLIRHDIFQVFVRPLMKDFNEYRRVKYGATRTYRNVCAMFLEVMFESGESSFLKFAKAVREYNCSDTYAPLAIILELLYIEKERGIEIAMRCAQRILFAPNKYIITQVNLSTMYSRQNFDDKENALGTLMYESNSIAYKAKEMGIPVEKYIDYVYYDLHYQGLSSICQNVTTWKDSIRMANQLKLLQETYNKNPDNTSKVKVINPGKVKYPKSLKLHHDVLVTKCSEMRKLVNIKHIDMESINKKYNHLEAEIDGYHFVLPKNTQDIVYEGDFLDHCVAGYVPDIVSGSTYIMFLREDPQTPFVTLEISPKSMTLLQAKRHGNTHPSSDAIKAIQKWVQKNKMQTLVSLQ